MAGQDSSRYSKTWSEFLESGFPSCMVAPCFLDWAAWLEAQQLLVQAENKPSITQGRKNSPRKEIATRPSYNCTAENCLPSKL